MHGIYHCSIRELSGSGRLFLYPSQPEMTREEKGRKGKGLKTQTLANRELQGKVGKRFLSDGKVRPQAVSEKIILAGGSGIFPENPAFPEAFAVGPL